MIARCVIFAALIFCAFAQNDISSRTVILRVEPQPHRAPYMKPMEAPHAVSQQQQQQHPGNPMSLPVPQTQQEFSAPPASMRPAPMQLPSNRAPIFAAPPPVQQPLPAAVNSQLQFPGASPPGTAPVVGAQTPVFNATSGQQFIPRNLEAVTPPPPPPVNIPPDVQNQLIKFFGLDSFGIPGLTGSHPNGFAGAIQELRAAGIPVQGLPAEHAGGQTVRAPQSDLLAQQNPAFANELNNFADGARSGNVFHSASNVPLPEAKPGENGLIGLLSSSIRKMVKDSGVADALSQGIPSVLGTGESSDPSPTSFQGAVAASRDSDPITEESASLSTGRKGGDVRRQQSAAQRTLNGIASVLGGGGGNSPTHAGLPRIPGLPILPGGIPRNSQGQIDVVNLIGSITRRISNGTTLADVLPPEQLQTLADNVTDALLPTTPEDFDLMKFMGRWFEGINSPRATEQRCVVHHYGGLTKNDKTATFTALKIYREGSEYGQVRYSIGYAFRGGNKNAMLQLHTSESSDAQPFWVYKLGPEGTDPFGNKQYEYAIVSNWVKYPVTVLVRDPDTFKRKYEPEVLRWLEDQGFVNGFVRAFNMLQPASYSQCQYADSTFEIFG